jgi:hypothetical protein
MPLKWPAIARSSFYEIVQADFVRHRHMMRKRPMGQTSGWSFMFCMVVSYLHATDLSPGHIETVNGPVPVAELGLVLEHEHVLVDFVGAKKVGAHRYVGQCRLERRTVANYNAPEG